ncbi:MAG: ATP-binding protein [Syntrophaceae bacterium]|nr:ATP-binding protein [Syntrophaceae bacterium]
MDREIAKALDEWKKTFPRKPLLLKGARQVGKTYVLKDFGQRQFPRFHYLNFEETKSLCNYFSGDLKPALLLDQLQFHLNAEIDAQNDLLIFDEIQNCSGALTSLKYFNEEMPDLAICAAGSLLGLSLTDESFPVGKVTFLDMWPMSFLEYLKGLGENMLAQRLSEYAEGQILPEAAHEKLWEIWKTYLIVGGLPEAVKTFSAERGNLFAAVKSVRKIQKDLKNSYLADIAKHSGKVNAMHIERLWHNIPAQLARAQDKSAPKFTFKDAISGIRGYERLAGPLDWLERARLATRLFIVENVGMPLSACRKENQFKLYFFDTGMLSSLADLPPEAIMRYGYGSYQGYVAENFVAQEFMAAGDNNLYGWQGRTSEVEFLLETKKGCLPCEVKSGKVTHSKSLSVYEERYKPERSFIISARNGGRIDKRIFVPLYAAGVLRSEIQ